MKIEINFKKNLKNSSEAPSLLESIKMPSLPLPSLPEDMRTDLSGKWSPHFLSLSRDDQLIRAELEFLEKMKTEAERMEEEVGSKIAVKWGAK